jgi:hypothetical protein
MQSIYRIAFMGNQSLYVISDRIRNEIFREEGGIKNLLIELE